MLPFDGAQTLEGKTIFEKLVVRRVILKLSACLGFLRLSDKACHSRTFNTRSTTMDAQPSADGKFLVSSTGMLLVPTISFSSSDVAF
jgi:hypothetical protein